MNANLNALPSTFPLTRELRALSITPKAVNAHQGQRQIEEQNAPQRQDNSENHSENDIPPVRDTQSEPELPSTMPETIKITKPDKFDGKDTSIATVNA